jgi:hypothetical protein
VPEPGTGKILGAVRAALDKLSWHVLDATLAALPRPVLARVALLTAPHEDRLSYDHARMLGMIRQHAGLDGQQPQVAAEPSRVPDLTW